MLAEIAAGVLVNVITATGRWIASSTISIRGGKKAQRDADIATWFDTYDLVSAESFPEMPGIPEDDVTAWLRRNDVHAVLHELLAVRLTAASESDAERLRGVLRRTTWDQFSSGAMSEVVRRRSGSAANIGARESGGPDMPPPSKRSADQVADLVFDWADGEICELVARLEARDPQRWRGARGDAFGARIVAVLNAIERHTSALDGDDVDDAEWAARYRRQAVQAYGSIEPPDFARRRKVPIADLYVPPDITVPDAPRDPDGTPRSVTFNDLVASIDRTVLLGDPGGGKSTAAQVITHRWAGDHEARVPFQVVLRDFSLQSSVVQHIEERLNAFHHCPSPAGAVERLLLSGEATVIFDGLDELVDTGRRLEVTRTIEQFCTHYPLTPVLVTSRKVGYDEARLDDTQFTRYTIAGFDEDRTREYVRRWFALEDDVPSEELAEAFMTESEPVKDLRSNPLMLSYLCVLYRGAGTLPRDRPAMYEQCTRLLLDTWDARRSIKIDLRARNHIEPALRHIAYWLFTRDGAPQVTERELVAHTAAYLHENAFERRADAEAAAREFIGFCRGRAWILSDAGTTARGEALYTFTHRTFLEYFAAYQLAGDCDTPERLARTLAPRVARAEWEVVAQLAVQIKCHAQVKAAERIYTTLLGEKRRRSAMGRGNVLRFLARCLQFVEPPPAVVRDLARTVMEHFTAGDPDDANRYSPLVELLARADAGRDSVAEEIALAADRMVASGGVARHRALLWIAAFDSALERTRGPFTDAADSDWDFWAALDDAMLRRHGEAIRDAAETDDRLWLQAVMRPADAPLLRLGDDLASRGRAPRPVLERRWYGAFDSGLGSLGAALLARARWQPDPERARSVQRLADLGAWLAVSQPPFFVASSAPTSLFQGLMYREPFKLPGLPPYAYLGAVVLLAAFAELVPSDGFEFEPTGALQPLAPYLRRETDNLPDLPVPPRFQELFRQWARGEVTFVEED